MTKGVRRLSLLHGGRSLCRRIRRRHAISRPRRQQLHREMCATIAIVIRASLERSSRIAEQVKKLIHVAGAVPCDEKKLETFVGLTTSARTSPSSASVPAA